MWLGIRPSFHCAAAELRNTASVAADWYNLCVLTTREQALPVWAVLALAGGLLQGPTRRAMGPVLRAFMSPKILVVVALTTAYLASLLWLASRLGLWDRGLLGPTLIWGLPTLLGVGLKAVQAMESEDFFKSSLKGLLSGAVVVEFLVNAETFPLWWELVQLPLIVTIVLLAELSKTDPEHASIRSCMSRVMAIGGTGMLLFSVIALVSKARERHGATSFSRWESRSGCPCPLFRSSTY